MTVSIPRILLPASLVGLALVAVVAAPVAAADQLTLTPQGLSIDQGPDGTLVLQYPVLITAGEREVPISDRSVQGAVAHLVYGNNGTCDCTLDRDGRLKLVGTGLPAGSQFRSTMVFSPDRAVAWAVGAAQPKALPAVKPSKPILYQDHGASLRLVRPSGIELAITVPAQAFHQLQDNREWGWKVFAWKVSVPVSEANSYEFTVTSRKTEGSTKTTAFLVDRFGQDAKAVVVDKVAREEELAQDAVQERAWYEGFTPVLTDRFGGEPGSKGRLGLSATGFFHMEQKGARWYLVDPDGNRFFHLGVCCFSPATYTYVSGREGQYEWIPSREGEFASAWCPKSDFTTSSVSYHIANLIRKYRQPVTLESFQTLMIERVRRWGFNSIGAFSEVSREAVGRANFPYTATLPCAVGWSGIPEIPGIHETFDPFDEEIRATFINKCQSLAARKDDPLLIGYFLCNEPAHEAVPRVIPTLKHTAAKRRLVRMLAEKYGTIDACNAAWNLQSTDFAALEGMGLPVTTRAAADDMQAYVAVFFDEYYRFVHDAVRAIDPNHLLIGDRWQPQTANDEQRCRIAGRYLDVISVNYYTYAVDPAWIGRIQRWTGGRPMIFSEFYWDSPSDSGLPGGVKDVGSQQERGLAYRNYVEHAATLGYVVGVQWYTLVDAPRTGKWFNKYNGECPNSGLFAVSDRPWKTLIGHMAQTNAAIWRVVDGIQKPFVYEDPRFVPGFGKGAGIAKIPHVSRPIPLNGQRDAWPGLPPELVPSARLVEGSAAGGLEGSFRLSWDEQNLHVLVDVTDATPMRNNEARGNLWRGDGVELFIGSDASREGSLLPGDRQILLGAGAADGSQVWVAKATQQPAIRAVVVQKVDGSGYIVQAAVPWNALGMTPAAGDILRFDLAIDDSSDGSRRLRQLMWNGTNLNAGDRTGWGRAVIGE